jgi:hypothetical protein
MIDVLPKRKKMLLPSTIRSRPNAILVQQLIRFSLPDNFIKELPDYVKEAGKRK